MEKTIVKDGIVITPHKNAVSGKVLYYILTCEDAENCILRNKEDHAVISERVIVISIAKADLWEVVDTTQAIEEYNSIIEVPED